MKSIHGCDVDFLFGGIGDGRRGLGWGGTRVFVCLSIYLYSEIENGKKRFEVGCRWYI